MRTLTIQQLDRATKRRKPGHRDAVLAVAQRDGDTLTLTDEQFQEIRAKYALGIRGMGDVIAAMTKAVGIKPCGGCQKRRETLNRILPFKAEQTAFN